VYLSFFPNRYDRESSWHVAAEVCNLEVLQKLWEWVKEVLTPEEFKKIVINPSKIWTNCLALRIVAWQHTCMGEIMGVG
jgi:hypothetical protein